MKNDIQNLEQCIKTIDSSQLLGNFYLSWLKTYLKDMVAFLKFKRFIPRIFRPNKYNRDTIIEKALNKITENNRIILKDIFLPIPRDIFSRNILFSMIIDNFLPYLLEDIDQETLYTLYSELSDFSDGIEGPYEYKKVQLEKGDIVIDAGANVGVFSALAGVKGCKAYAFEPTPSIIDKYLSKTTGWNPNVTICQYALLDKSVELIFDEDLSNIGGSSSFMIKDNSNKIKVQAMDLDTYVDMNNLSSVDFIKADIEGAERYMLMGAKGVLKEFAPKISICTYHFPDDPKVLRELILDANPNYIIEERWKKIYGHVPKN